MMQIFTLFLCGHLMAAPQSLEINSSLFFEGKKIGSPRIIAEVGKTASILMNDEEKKLAYNLEVEPTMKANGKVELIYALTIRSRRNETLSRGRINLRMNQRGKVALDKDRIKILFDLKKRPG